MSTDAQLTKRIQRTQRRLRRVRRKRPEALGRIERLQDRLARLNRLLELPEAERPRPVRLNLDLVRTALDTALVVLAATPVGPAIGAVKLGLGAVQGVSKAVGRRDVPDTLDALTEALRAELARRGVELDEDDDALLAFADALEDQLEPELKA